MRGYSAHKRHHHLWRLQELMLLYGRLAFATGSIPASPKRKPELDPEEQEHQLAKTTRSRHALAKSVLPRKRFNSEDLWKLSLRNRWQAWLSSRLQYQG